MSAAPRQLGLPFPETAYYDPTDFLPGACNEAALAWIAQPRTWPGGRLAVCGPEGVGKTHLLHVFAARHGAALLPVHALPRLPDLPAAPLAIDDADEGADPRALLHVLNFAAERGYPVVLAGRHPPAAWPVSLPDLASRLRAVQTVAILPPEDDLLAPLLARKLAERQLRVPEHLQAWLLKRLPRTGGALRAAAARLDRLSQGMTLTRAHAALLVAELLGEAEAAERLGGAPLL